MLIMGFVVLLGSNASAQSYEDMPVAVQQKMNDNKINGLPDLQGIFVDYEFTIDGVNTIASANEFESFMRVECGITEFNYSSANHHVSFTIPATTSMVEIRDKMTTKGFGFGLFFKEVYHI